MQEQHKKQPEISIIVPVYKTERFLSACISSILAQTFTDFELILVDDGSPDSCPALCDAAAAKDSRIRVIHQKNRGLSGARNAGLDAAEGEWIAFVDSDDTITPDFCAKLYHAAQEAGAEMAVCNYRQVDEALTPIREQYLHVRREVLTPEQALEHSTLLPYMVVWNKLYHRSIFAQLRFAEGKLNEDTLLIAYAYEKADRIANIPDALYLYRKVAGSIVNSKVTLRQQNRPIELFERAVLGTAALPDRCGNAPDRRRAPECPDAAGAGVRALRPPGLASGTCCYPAGTGQHPVFYYFTGLVFCPPMEKYRVTAQVCLDFPARICYNNKTITNTRGGVAGAFAGRSKST